MRYVGVATVVVALSAAALSGCEHEGGGTAPHPAMTDGPPPVADPRAEEGGLPPSATGCSALGPPRVAEALATDAVEAVEDSSGRICRYVLADGTTVLTVSAGDLPRAVLGGPAQVAAAAAGPGTAQPVGGVGDAAYFYVTAQGAHALTLATGSGQTVTSVTLTAGGPALRAPRDRLADLAREVLRAYERARAR